VIESHVPGFKGKPEREAGRFVFKDTEFLAPSSARALDRVLREHAEGASWNEVRRVIRTGKVKIDDTVQTDATHTVSPGARIVVRMSTPKAAAAAATGGVSRTAIVFEDVSIVVVRKPAGIATVPHEDERDTLDRLVQSLLRKTARPGTSIAPLGVVQRLDKETSGLLVFARTATAKRGLQQQLRVHSVHRRYVAIAHGRVASRTFRSFLVADRGDGRRGSTENPEIGREAVTHVRALETLAGATLVECELETGRTHQIRIHLSEAGHPLLGERVYAKRYGGILLEAPRVMLHAAELGFEHPVTGEQMHFEEPLPEDMVAVADRLRGAG
jgi:23S rRNA pseudouridine1911/1915/1917 synthase